jgi:hypothetical protein
MIGWLQQAHSEGPDGLDTAEAVDTPCSAWHELEQQGG